MKLNKDQKVKYLKDIPYILANGQKANNIGEEIVIKSDVIVRDGFFSVIENKEKEEPKDNDKNVESKVNHVTNKENDKKNDSNSNSKKK